MARQMTKKRNYKAEYRRRNQLARSRGFRSYGQQRRFSPKLRGPRDLGRLPAGARDARSDALHVVGMARDRGISIEEAARENQIPIHVVRWWGSEALQPKRGGLTQPKRGDRLLRVRPIILDDGDGVEFVSIRGSNAAYRAQQIFDVQYRFIEGTASEGELAGIAEKKVAGRQVESDPDRLEAIAEADGMDVIEAYREALG